MTSEIPASNSDTGTESRIKSSPAGSTKVINYRLRFINIITLGYVTIGVVLLSFLGIALWGMSGEWGAAIFVLLIILAMLALGGTPIVVIVSLILAVVCLRYLVLDRLSGKLRVVAIVTAIVSIALAVASGLYFFTYANLFTV
jgi:hypothetical protein